MKRLTDPYPDAKKFDNHRSNKVQRSELCNKDFGDISRDRISELPNHLLSLILSNLSLRDIHRTHSLSCCWKDIWYPMSNLVLDWPNVCSSNENSHTWTQNFNDPCVEYKHIFVQGVNHIITNCSSQEGNLFSFKISFCLGHDDTNDIDRWLRLALQKGTQKIYLEFFCPRQSFQTSHSIDDLSKDVYTLRCDPFYGIENNLKSLNIRGCKLGHNFAGYFHCLENLSLHQMLLISHALEHLLADLLNLKALTFTQCVLQTKLTMSSFTLLRELHLGTCNGIREIELSNLNLISFFCTSQVKCNYDGAPNLKSISCNVDKLGFKYMFSRLPLVFPELDTFEIFSDADWVNGVPNDIAIFTNVHILNIKFLNRHNKFVVSKLMHIISFFPQLNVLSVETQCFEDSEEDVITRRYVTLSLKEIYIFGFTWTMAQITFAAHCFRIAPNFKVFHINKDYSDGYLVKVSNPWKEEEMVILRNMIKEVLVNI